MIVNYKIIFKNFFAKQYIYKLLAIQYQKLKKDYRKYPKTSATDLNSHNKKTEILINSLEKLFCYL